jgi:hypothetical protein
MIARSGPWHGSKEGEIDRLRLPYRVMLGEQGFAIVYAHVSRLQLEAANVRVTENTKCPARKGDGHVPMHGGLRDKDCPRCGGKGWIKAPPGQ